MPTFDADTLRALRDVQEPAIRTDRNPKSAVVIWVVVESDDVFARSWLGARGHWHKACGRRHRHAGVRRSSSAGAGVPGA